MRRKYRYLNKETRSYAYRIIGLWLLLATYLLLTDRELSQKIFIVVVTIIIVTLVMLEGGKENTYIELSDEGILYSSDKKRIFSPWDGLILINLGHQKMIRKIVTRNGSFDVGSVRPFEIDPKSLQEIIETELDLMRNRSWLKWNQELTDEITKRAPNVVQQRSLVDRDLVIRRSGRAK